MTRYRAIVSVDGAEISVNVAKNTAVVMLRYTDGDYQDATPALPIADAQRIADLLNTTLPHTCCGKY